MADFKHGCAKRSGLTKEYIVWRGIRERCLGKYNKRYNDYGGRGIKICNRWKYSFLNFLKDMGKCPEGYTIERIDNNGNYEPNNCKWATRKEQGQNKRNNIILEYNGVKKTLQYWSDYLNIDAGTIKYHVNKNKSMKWIINYFKNIGKRRTFINFRGKIQSISDWSRELGIPLKYLSNHYTKNKETMDLIIRKYIIREYRRNNYGF